MFRALNLINDIVYFVYSAVHVRAHCTAISSKECEHGVPVAKIRFGKQCP